MTNIDKTMELMTKGMTVSQALKEVYKTRKLLIPFVDEDFDIDVKSLNLSNRSANALLRSGLKTLREAVDYINTNGWHKINNFGKQAAEELYEKIVDVSWNHMSTERRALFLIHVDVQNEAK